MLLGRLIFAFMNLALILSLQAPGPAMACASCGCGDDTLTAMGVERPFKGRIRLSLEQRLGLHHMGLPGEDNLISKTALGASWSPLRRLTLGALLPMIAVRTTSPRRDPVSVVGLGDLEIFARAVVFQERRFAPRHILSLLGGLKTPTGPRVNDSTGYPAEDDTQPGSGSWDPIFGASYLHFGDRSSFFLSATGRLTTTGYDTYRRGAALGISAAAQVPVARLVSVVLQTDLGYTRPDRLGDGADAPDTGGTMLALTPGVLVSLHMDWLLRLALQVPILQRWNGAQNEAPMGIASLVVDL